MDPLNPRHKAEASDADDIIVPSNFRSMERVGGRSAAPAQQAFSDQLEEDDEVGDETDMPVSSLSISAILGELPATGKVWMQAGLAAGMAVSVGLGAIFGGPLGFALAGLASALGLMKSVFSMSAEMNKLKAENVTLRTLATTDTLTGLANRRSILERIEHEAEQGWPLGLMVIDIDHFKQVNDTYGHAVGDVVLVEVAGRMRKALGSSGWLGRLGGEEFAVVMPGHEADLVDMAEHLRRCVAEQPVAFEQGALTVTVSIGIVLSRPPQSVHDALSAADAALYRAKHAGRNQVMGAD